MTPTASALAPLLPASPVAATGARSPSAAAASAADADRTEARFAATLERARMQARSSAANAAQATAAKTPTSGENTARLPAQGSRADGDNARANEAAGTRVDESPAGGDTNPATTTNPNRDPSEPGPELAQRVPVWTDPAVAAAVHEAAGAKGPSTPAATPSLDTPRARHAPSPLADLAAAAAASNEATPARAGGAGSREFELPGAASESAMRPSEKSAPPASLAAAALAAPALRDLLLATSAASAAGANSLHSAFDAHLAAAVESAAFAPTLATQVAWLVRDGVTQARLSLNPAEMGPVAVQIVLDGHLARVDFSAELAATRAAIEASLPTLAAALQDSGLTLAGGGVFDGRPRQGAPGQTALPAQARVPGQAAASDADAAARAGDGPLRAARGLVDLVA